MPRRAQPTQLPFLFGDPKSRPPAAPPTPDVLETLADLLLTAMAGLESGEAGDEPEDRR